MAQNYWSNGNPRASRPSENNGSRMQQPRNEVSSNRLTMATDEDFSSRQRMMAYRNKCIEIILTRHTLTTWKTSHCTLHQVLFFFSLSRVFKCDGIFAPKELGAAYADCKENTLRRHFRDYWLGGVRSPQLLGGEIGDGSRTPFCLALSRQNHPVFRVSMKNDGESNR